jgi:hypothetical protein
MQAEEATDTRQFLGLHFFTELSLGMIAQIVRIVTCCKPF